jgi:glucosylglycerate phosphorylase
VSIEYEVRDMTEKLWEHLEFIYGDQGAEVVAQTHERLRALLLEAKLPPPRHHGERLSQRDAVLITYGDQIRREGEAPLKALGDFLRRRLQGVVSGVHLLPFYPYTSDDGFSVVDYLKVDPTLGDWEDITAIGEDFRLMFDAVVNHVSQASEWFRGFLRDDSRYRDYFIVIDPDTDLSGITRPRTSPLLIPFETPSGTKHVWTTFSSDQIDLNYENPELLLEIVRVLLEYVAKGAEIIRLDAVTYLWKEVGTSGVHHPKTHRVMQLCRSVMDTVAPQVVLLTETNVPHEENVSYFGDGYNEAQMVYNFALLPLVLYSFMNEDAGALGTWAAGLKTPSTETAFFNFLASHDGIGVRPVESILGRQAIMELVERVKAHGGLVSFKTNAGGSQSPYELNINYFDALSLPKGDEPLELQVARFMSAQAIMLSLAGVPGIYVHSLLGSRSFHEGVKRTGHNRAINREKFELEPLEAELDDPESLRYKVFTRFKRLLEVRTREPAFHPQAAQRILQSPKEVFALRRGEGEDSIFCFHNVSAKPRKAALELRAATDLLSGERLKDDVTLEAYGVRWLKPA